MNQQEPPNLANLFSPVKPALVAPRPLKHSGGSVPLFIPGLSLQTSLPAQIPEDCEEQHAEWELRQIFGLCSSFDDITTLATANPMFDSDDLSLAFSADRDSFDPFCRTQIGTFDLPRLGASPGEQQGRYPARARNPMTLNTPFEMQREVELQNALVKQLKMLDLDFFDPLDWDPPAASGRNRSFSEPLPFVQQTVGSYG